jgi:tetratricopeptide (TPR) repeat protein/DNA-directed RNA polymerase subunit F
VEARLKKKKGLTNPLKRSLRLKLAEVYARELGKLDEAVASYRDLVESDPTDTDTIQTLDQILRSTGRKDDLRWLFQLRADQVEGTARGEIFEEWATLEEEVFGDAKAACELLRKVIEITPTRGEALRSLSRLLIQEGDFAAAAEAVERHRDVSEGAERARREVDLAALYLDHLGRPAAAFDAAVRALGLAAHDNEAIAILARLVEQPETRVSAAEVLVTEYDALGDARREVGALAVVLEAEKSGERRLALHLEIASVHEKKLSAPGTAFDAVLKALTEFPAELALWDRANDLANVAVRPTDLAEAYRTHLMTTATADRSLPSDVELELCERAASLHDERLGDAEGAMPYLERVLAVAPTNERAFRRLKQILTTNERWVELEALYERAAQGTTDERMRIELLSEVALVAEEIIGSAPQAIGYYERVLAIDALCEPAIQALEKLYEREERWSDLAELLERRLDTATEAESIVCRKTLGGLYIERLASPERALAHLEEVLEKRHEDLHSRELVEKLLAVPELRQRAARVLERVYEGRDEIRALVRILDIRRESANDEEKRELLRRAATYRDERLKDDPGAFSVLAELLPMEPEEPSARERFVAIGRRLGEHEMVALVLSDAAEKCRSTESRAQILMEVARICEDMLGDVARAEGVYKAILQIDPNDPSLVIPAAQALSRIYATDGRHDDLAGSLAVEVRLEDNVETRRALYERIGTLHDGVLDQPEKAIEAWNARLADEPSDGAALTALERLYERTAAWRRLVEVLHTREQNATDPAERRRTMVRGAEILAKELGDVPEAINAWRAVLDELGPEKPTLTALEALYEKAERWVDLAETLEVDLSLTDETPERLALLVRLGDVRRLHQDDLPGALDAYRQALVLDPTHAPSCKALEAMLELESARRDAAAILRPLYEADGDAERLLRVLEIQVETGDSVSEQLADVEMLYRTAEGPLGDTGRAYGYALRGVRMAAAEPELGKLIETLERFSESTGRWAETAALYQEIEGEILDGEVQQSVRLRIGELARTRLDDRALAITYYKKALEAHGDDRRAMLALEELYAAADDAPALLQILKTRVDYAESDEEKKKLLFRVAELSRGALADRAAAIATYEEVLGVGLDPAAITALEELYRQAERFGDLIALYERQLEAGGPSAELHVKIAIVARSTGDVTRAFDELGAALGDDPTHEGAIAELETLLAGEDKEQRARAGEMLEPVYLARADWAKVKLALGARLAATEDVGERRELLQKLAALQEEQLEDYRAALDTVAELLHEDLSDEDVWKELDRLAKVAGAEKRLAEIYAKELGALSSDDASSAKLCRITGDLFVAQGEQEAALTWYRRAHAEAPESEELFQSIDAILVAKERHAERVELYRGALDHRYAEDRLATLHTIAGLLRKELSDPAGAIETYRAALDADENDTISLEALTELYAQLGRHRDLAEHYQRRAESTADVEASAAFRLEWAKLLRGPLDDTSGAIDQLETIVNDVPWNAAAVTELEALLESDEHKARVVDILRPIYERSDDWKKLIKLNRVRLALADSAGEKVAILRENAVLLETRGDDQLGAFEAVRTAFELDAEDGETRRELERLAGELGAFEELALSLETGATATSDDLVKRELFTTLARIYNERSDDPRRALDAFARLSALDPSDPEPLTAMDDLAVLLADWATVISVLEKKSVIASDDENASIQRRIAETKLDMLDDVEGAIAAYERALELDPRSAFTIDRLIELYEPRDAARRLVELYHQRVELSEPDEADLRYDLNLAAATRYEKSLANPREAIGALSAALDARPSDPAVLKNLERLYRAEEMWHELLENLKLQAAAAETKDARVALRRDIGDLYAGKLDTPSDALEQYRLLLDEEAGDEHASHASHAIHAILAIGEAQDGLRLEAADALEPVLRAASRHADLVTVLELRLRAQSEPADRARTLRTIASVYDADLSRPADAVTALLRALEDAPDDPFLHQEIERLAEPAQAFGRYADTLAQRAAGIFDTAIATDLFVRLGRVAEEKLEDDARAVDAYVKAIEHAGDKPELLAALDRLYGRLGDAKALADVLERRVSSADGDAEAAELHHRLAVIQIESFGDRAQGLGTLRQALERAPAHAGARAALEKLTEHKDLFEEAAEALETVYRSQADYVALAALGEKRVSFAESPAERVRLRLDLARIQEEQGDDAKAAQATLEKALGDDPTDADVLAELERLAPVTDGWKGASDALEAAVRGRDDVPSDTARDLWTRIAAWRKDKLADAEGSERALEEARKLDPSSEWVLRSIEGLQRVPGRERDLVGTLRRLAALDGIAGASDLRREAKTLAESALTDTALAEQILREMIAADDADTWALTELGLLREAAEAWEEVFSLLQRRIELSASGDSLRTLRHQAATVARNRLSSNDRAIGLLEQCFEDEPMDRDASNALRELYAEGGKHKEHIALLTRLVDIAESPAERSLLRLETAKICLEKLDAPGEAMDHLKAILDEEPGHEEATLTLSTLYEKTGRDQDLAELLTSQIELAERMGDVGAELRFRVRLGEVFETRLGDVPRAIATYEAVLEREAAHKGALLALARLFEHKGDKAAAATKLERVLGVTQGADAVPLALRLADLYVALKDDDATRKALERGLAEGPTDRTIRDRLLALYEKQSAWAELADLITGDARAATEAPEKVRLYQKAADIQLQKRKDSGSAADLLEKASELVPGDRELLLALCDAYSASGRGKQAIVALKKIVDSYGGRRSKELAGIQLRLARAFVADGDKDQALIELDIAFKIDPGSVHVLRELGLLSLDLADSATDDAVKAAHVERAAKSFRALLLQRLDDTSPITKAEVFYRLGDISNRQGDPKKAIQNLERAIDNDKELTKAKELLATLKAK